MAKQSPVLESIAVDEDAALCADTLRERLVAGAYPEGARLPAERLLAEEFGVSRGTLRNALAQLTTQGLLRVRQGSGYTVCAWRRESGPELLGALSEARKVDRHVLARDLLAMRRALALVVLERLTQVDFDVRPIRRAVDEFGLGAERGMSPEEAASLDLAVLTEIVEATGSVAFQLSLNPITRVLAQLSWLRDAMYAAPKENSAGYDALVAWLASPHVGGLAMVAEALGMADERTLGVLSEKKRATRKGGVR